VTRCTIEQAGVLSAEAEARPDGLDHFAVFRLQHHFDQVELLGVRQLAGLPSGRLSEDAGGLLEVTTIAMAWSAPCASGSQEVMLLFIGTRRDADLT
jgi:hypothetical protein